MWEISEIHSPVPRNEGFLVQSHSPLSAAFLQQQQSWVTANCGHGCVTSKTSSIYHLAIYLKMFANSWFSKIPRYPVTFEVCKEGHFLVDFLHFLFYVCLYVCIFGCAGSSLLHAGFCQLRRVGTTVSCGAWASHCGGFSRCRGRAPGRGSAAAAHGVSSCGVRA